VPQATTPKIAWAPGDSHHRARWTPNTADAVRSFVLFDCRGSEFEQMPPNAASGAVDSLLADVTVRHHSARSRVRQPANDTGPQPAQRAGVNDLEASPGVANQHISVWHEESRTAGRRHDQRHVSLLSSCARCVFSDPACLRWNSRSIPRVETPAGPHDGPASTSSVPSKSGLI
jgi:hypothetical protein